MLRECFVEVPCALEGAIYQVKMVYLRTAQQKREMYMPLRLAACTEDCESMCVFASFENEARSKCGTEGCKGGCGDDCARCAVWCENRKSAGGRC